jgi:F-type H+-transporting ATPase subunit b
MSGLALLSTARAWAAGAGGAGHHEPSIGEIVFPAINFVLYAGVLYYFALPLVRNFLRSRREDIVATMAQAAAKKQQAEALVREYRAKLAGVDREIQSIQSLLRHEGEVEKAKQLNEAQAVAAKIREDARFLADLEVKTARQDIIEEMARQAEAMARDLVQRNISPDDQGRLAQEFIQQIGQAR